MAGFGDWLAAQLNDPAAAARLNAGWTGAAQGLLGAGDWQAKPVSMAGVMGAALGGWQGGQNSLLRSQAAQAEIDATRQKIEEAKQRGDFLRSTANRIRGQSAAPSPDPDTPVPTMSGAAAPVTTAPSMAGGALAGSTPAGASPFAAGSSDDTARPTAGGLASLSDPETLAGLFMVEPASAISLMTKLTPDPFKPGSDIGKMILDRTIYARSLGEQHPFVQSLDKAISEKGDPFKYKERDVPVGGGRFQRQISRDDGRSWDSIGPAFLKANPYMQTDVYGPDGEVGKGVFNWQGGGRAPSMAGSTASAAAPSMAGSNTPVSPQPSAVAASNQPNPAARQAPPQAGAMSSNLREGSNMTVGPQAPTPSGFTAPGITVLSTKPKEPIDKELRRKIEEKALTGTNTLDRLTMMEQAYRPEYLTYAGAGRARVADFLNNLHPSLRDKWTADRSAFANMVETNSAELRLYFTGQASGEKEMARLSKMMPSVEDSPQTFEAKMQQTKRALMLAQRRQEDAIRSGIRPTYTNDGKPTGAYAEFLQRQPQMDWGFVEKGTPGRQSSAATGLEAQVQGEVSKGVTARSVAGMDKNSILYLSQNFGDQLSDDQKRLLGRRWEELSRAQPR